MTKYRLDVQALVKRLDHACVDAGIRPPRMLQETGVAASTYSRMRKGGAPDAHALVSLLRWLEDRTGGDFGALADVAALTAIPIEEGGP